MMLPSALSLLLSPPLLCLTPLLLLINPSPSGPAPPVSPPITCPSAPKKEGTDGRRPQRARWPTRSSPTACCGGRSDTAATSLSPKPNKHNETRRPTEQSSPRRSSMPPRRRHPRPAGRPTDNERARQRPKETERAPARQPARFLSLALCEVVPLLEGDDVDTRGGDAFSGASGCSGGRRPRRPRRRPRRSPRGVSVRRAGGRKGPRTDRRTEARWAKAGQILHPTTAENCGRRVNKKRTESGHLLARTNGPRGGWRPFWHRPQTLTPFVCLP